MAIYSSLPVYKESYKLMIAIYAFTKNMTREYKFTLGEKLKNESTELLLLIYDANCDVKQGKNDIIKKTIKKLEVIRLLIRVCYDVKICKIKSFISLNEKIEVISKQLTAWSKYIEKNFHSESVA